MIDFVFKIPIGDLNLNWGLKRLYGKVKIMLEGLCPPIVRGALCPPHPTPEVPPQGPALFWLQSLLPTGYRVSLVNVSESGSQKSASPQFTVNQCRIQAKSTISQKLIKTKKKS